MRARKQSVNPSDNWLKEAPSRLAIERAIMSFRLLGSLTPFWRGSPVSCMRTKVTPPSVYAVQPPGLLASPKTVFVEKVPPFVEPSQASDPPPKIHVPSSDAGLVVLIWSPLNP